MPAGIVDLLADSNVSRWARDCAWTPGTGHCRNQPCNTACSFRAQREAEMQRVIRARQRRRTVQQQPVERLVRRLWLLASAFI
jgi:hypothetical protein